MEIFSKVNKNKNLSLALGYFDGVHRGHQAVIKKAAEYAKSYGTKSAVITFKDHPCCFFWGVCPKYILSRDARRNKIAELGVDYLYELDFAELSEYSAENYLQNVLVDNFSPIAISTGFNHHFGNNKSGTPEYLAANADKFGYKYFITEAEKYNGEIISSTLIRKALSEGNIELANMMLGYKFTITGEVVQGQQLGRKIGFRTANLKYPAEIIDLPFGAYATKVSLNGKKYNAVTNFGIKPTVSDGKNCTLESHILDFSEDIYGEIISIEFNKMLRGEQKFNSVDELKTQIKKDIIEIYN